MELVCKVCRQINSHQSVKRKRNSLVFHHPCTWKLSLELNNQITQSTAPNKSYTKFMFSVETQFNKILKGALHSEEPTIEAVLERTNNNHLLFTVITSKNLTRATLSAAAYIGSTCSLPKNRRTACTYYTILRAERGKLFYLWQQWRRRFVQCGRLVDAGLLRSRWSIGEGDQNAPLLHSWNNSKFALHVM